VSDKRHDGGVDRRINNNQKIGDFIPEQDPWMARSRLKVPLPARLAARLA
jgi:hypothetical protein